MADLDTVARPYAKALFDLAQAQGRLAEWSAALNTAAAVAGNEDAERHLGQPELRAEQRADFVADLAGALGQGEMFGSGEGRNLLALLAENDRLAALPDIAAQFDRLKVEAENKVRVTLVSAEAVDSQTAAKVTEALERKLGRKVELELEVDARLIGGAIIRAEDKVIDGSVRSRLERLAATMID